MANGQGNSKEHSMSTKEQREIRALIRTTREFYRDMQGIVEDTLSPVVYKLAKDNFGNR